MREATPPRWPRAILGAAAYEEFFEPAWHEAWTERVEAGGAAAGPGIRGRTVVLVVQCAWLRLMRPGVRRRGRDGRMAMILDDVKYAVRALRRRPGFAAIAILTLGLGIGANAAIFGVINGMLLKPLPFPESDELVVVQARSPQGFGVSLSLPNHRDWRDRNRVFTGLGAAAGWSMVHLRPEGARIVDAQITIGDFFEVLGARAVVGRTYTAAEAERGGEAVAVLTWGYWQREFAGDPSVVGRTLNLDGREHTVIGVLRADFVWPPVDTELYAPMGAIASLPWDDRRSSFGAQAVARLAPGATLATAQADIDRITRGIDEAAGFPVVTAEVCGLRDCATGEAARSYLLLMGAVAFVLLIAGVNVANLLLVRGEERRRELAVRAALGAGRAAIARQVLVESLTIAVAGAGVGLALAWAGVILIRGWMPLPPLVGGQVGIDATVLVFVVCMSVLAGIIFGLIPAMRLSADIGSSELREGARGTGSRSRQRIRSALVVAETTLALVLLIGSGLMIASLSQLRSADVGYDAQDVLTARLRVPLGDNPDRERWRSFYETVESTLAGQPGVSAASISLLVPLASRSWERLVLPEGAPFTVHDGESVLYNIVSPSWFQAMGVPVLRGRAFDARDHNDSDPVTIIDQTMADLYWPGEDPIGRRITFEWSVNEAGDTIPTYRTVVGVVSNVRHYEMREPSRVQAYVPLAQTLRTWGTSLNAVVRVAGDAAAFAPRLRSVVAGIDRNVAVSDVSTLEGYIATDMADDTALGGMLAAFGALALGLAAIGVFGVMSLVVARRTREIGVRLAIGARPPQVLAMVLGRTMALTGAGVVLGLLAAAGLSRLLGAFLYELSPLSPAVYGGASLFLLAVAAAAALLPALRAARIDPIRTLREEG